MAMIIDIQVTKQPWLGNPRERWNNGLLSAGAAWKSANEYYPAQAPGSSYARTRTLANKAQFNIVSMGQEEELLEVTYWKYVMFGTGLYGPRNAMIYPVNAKMLAWQATAGPMAGQWIFAHAVSGFIWEGRLDQIKQILKDAFAAGIRNNDPSGGG